MSDLAVLLRPKTFDKMIGMDSLLKKIQGHFNKHRDPNGWILAGETGSGKTTLARTIALSMQCKHQKSFGNPCKKCIKHRKSFNIIELSMPDIGVKELRERLDGYELNPMPGSPKRVYILDEFHRTSGATQDLMLKFIEDSPKLTKWIICTTDPGKIIATLRSRCQCYVMPGLDRDGIKLLVKRAMEHCESDKNQEDLVDALMEKNITSPRRVIRAVEKYSDTDSSPEDAAKVDIVTNANIKAITRGVVKGSWEKVAQNIRDVVPGDIPQIKAALASYMNEILLGDEAYSKRSDIVAKSIIQLYTVRDEVPVVSAILYRLCRYFERYG